MTVTQIQTAILNGNFTERELRDINGTIVNILKADRKRLVAEAKRKFHVGDTVTWGDGFTSGKIVKVNRTKCIVDTGGLRGRWSIPMTMLMAV